MGTVFTDHPLTCQVPKNINIQSEIRNFFSVKMPQDDDDCKTETRPRQRRRSVSFSEEITIIGFSEPCIESVMYESESHRQIIGIQELYLSDHEYVKNGKWMGKLPQKC